MKQHSCLNSHFDEKKKVIAIAWSFSDFAQTGAVSDKGIVNYSLKKSEIFHKEFKNYGRLDATSKSVCNAIAALLKQVDLYPLEKKLDIPVFFSSEEGSFFSDIDYYSDYVKFNETAGRANKFLYTLPTSPLGEASVHFGLIGSLVYVCDSGNSISKAFNMADNFFNINASASKFAIVGFAASYNNKQADALFFLISNSNNDRDILFDMNKIDSFLNLKKRIIGDFAIV